MMYRRLSLLLLLFSISPNGFAQDLAYAKKTISTLTSETYWGRGYTKKGMQKAADFIESEYKKLGLTPIGQSGFQQYFYYPVNTFPGKMLLKLNGKTLSAGKDFIVHQGSKGLTSTVELSRADSNIYVNQAAKLVLAIVPKLTWSVAQKAEDYTLVQVAKTAINTEPKSISLAIENELIPHFRAANVCGIVKGSTRPDSVIAFTAHYDHLGGMGNKVYFPGANDNASGVALLLNLAKHYAANPPKYSVAFICFAGEEAGLVGSRYFTENPLLPLNQIRFLWNLDLVGTGETGATVVNATVHTQEFALLNKINEVQHWLPKINARGKAANSDHYFFTEKGVPAFFLYTTGGIAAYHDVNDKAQTLPLTAYENLFKLFVAFNAALMN